MYTNNCTYISYVFLHQYIKKAEECVKISEILEEDFLKEKIEEIKKEEMKRLKEENEEIKEELNK
jgi:hypothetical protein